MNRFVAFELKRNRGWPWPEASYGLDPMYGTEGWCRLCGVPRGPQTGSLVLQKKGLTVEGVWVPNWQFDAICMERAMAAELANRFRLDFLPVLSPTTEVGASQMVVPSTSEAWFDPEELAAAATQIHGVAGATCAECGVWRWMPVPFGALPTVHVSTSWASADIVASPEWFGDGLKTFREILIRRELAEALVGASPKDGKVREITQTSCEDRESQLSNEVDRRSY